MRRWKRIHDDSGKDYTFNRKAAAELVLKIICREMPNPAETSRIVEIERVSNPWPQLLSQSK